MKYLGIDPGQKRIGIAVSDDTGSFARPLRVVQHTARAADAAEIVRLAEEQGALAIVIGQSFDEDGNLTFQGRGAASLGKTIEGMTNLPVVYWDEAFTTQDARAARLAQGASRHKRSGHLDDLAAAILLQSYLDTRQTEA